MNVATEQTAVEDRIDVTGLDLPGLVVALYAGTHAVGLGVLNDRAEGITREMAAEELRVASRQDYGIGARRRVRLDWVHGRPLKVEFTEEDGRTYLERMDLYDRDGGGPGRCREVVEAFKGGAATPAPKVDPIIFELAREGIVPQTCTFPGEHLLMIVMVEGQAGRGPCDRCNHDRAVCKGKPRIGAGFGA